jgi:glycosyltransferase involved in cell wall biosynthesis
MARMAEDTRLREKFGKAARKLVEAEFSAEAIGRETVALYDAILGR